MMKGRREKMNEHVTEMIKDLSEAAFAIVSAICVIATTRHKLKKSKKSKRRKR